MRLRYLVPVLLATIATAIPAKANLIITPIFDSSITTQAGAAAIETTINAAIAVFESTYTNPITVTIDFEAINSGLGQSQIGFDYLQNYHSFYNALVAKNANPAAIAGLTANGGNSANNPVTGGSQIGVTSANSRALGLASSAPLCNVTGAAGSLSCSGVAGGVNAIDGIIGVNTGITYPPQPNDGSKYGLMAVLEHEIDEILGTGSSLNGCNGCGTVSSTTPSPEDLFRYTAAGARSSLSVNCGSPGTAFFSYSGATDLAQFNNACNGADFGDWATGPTAQVQDAFGNPGPQPTYGANEIAALSAIGFTVATPEPATSTLLLASLGVFALVRKRFTRRPQA